MSKDGCPVRDAIDVLNACPERTRRRMVDARKRQMQVVSSKIFDAPCPVSQLYTVNLN